MTPLPLRQALLAAAACALAGAILALVVPGSASAGAFVRLRDGRVLEGTDVRREGNLYLLEVEGGSVIPLPVEAVEEVGLTGEPRGEPEPPPPREIPTGLTVGGPAVLAGVEVRPTSPSEALAVFGKPAEFQEAPFESSYEPSYWVMDPAENNWNPSKWAKAPTDPIWTPTPAFDMNKDVLEQGRSKWAQSPTDSTWVPTDAFKKGSSSP